MDAALLDPNERCTSGWDFAIISTWTLHFWMGLCNTFDMDAALPDPNESCTSGSDFEIISTWTLHFRTRMNAALLDGTLK
jgi:hypothetical protein